MNALQISNQQLSSAQLRGIQDGFEDLAIPVCGQFEYVFPDHYMVDLDDTEEEEVGLALIH